MVGMRVGKFFEADEAHEIFYFAPFCVQYAARNQASLNVPADGEPRKKIWVLKNQSVFRTGTFDRLIADQKFA